MLSKSAATPLQLNKGELRNQAKGKKQQGLTSHESLDLNQTQIGLLTDLTLLETGF